MLAYLASKEQFLKDAPTIEDIVAAEVKKNLFISVGNSEYQSWRNSLGNAMSHVMLDPGIPGDAAVAIEYRLNGRKFRIDFLIAGQDDSGRVKAAGERGGQLTTRAHVEPEAFPCDPAGDGRGKQ